MSGPHWLIYALGGGLGHVTRATSLIRAAEREGVTCTVLANTSLLASLPLRAELNLQSHLLSAAGESRPVEQIKISLTQLGKSHERIH